MINSFRDQATEDIFNGFSTKVARKSCPQKLWGIARRKLDQLDSVIALAELNLPPGNHLEKLGGDKVGQYSDRINDQYRVCFSWGISGPANVYITDYH